MTMRVIDLGINKELFDKIYDLIVATMQHSDRFWYEVPFTKQNIITILWLANYGGKMEGEGVKPSFFCSEPRVAINNARFLRLRYHTNFLL